MTPRVWSLALDVGPIFSPWFGSVWGFELVLVGGKWGLGRLYFVTHLTSIDWTQHGEHDFSRGHDREPKSDDIAPSIAPFMAGKGTPKDIAV